MQKKLYDFACQWGIDISADRLQLLTVYADLVWEKKDMLNLTSVSDKQEIFMRHLCDGIMGAYFLKKQAGNKEIAAADMGSGAGYIGLTAAIVLPQVKITLVESLQKRCHFLNWVAAKLALKNIEVVPIRLGQQAVGPFEVIMERAMGQLQDILPWIAPVMKEGGHFAAYQSSIPQVSVSLLETLRLVQQQSIGYVLPNENKERYLTVFEKYGYR